MEQFLIHPEVRKYLVGIVKSMNIAEYIITIEPGSVKGENYLGVIAKVLIKGKKNGENIIMHWIVKSAPQNPVLRKYIHMDKVYGREAYVYKELFPYFMKFQKEKCIEEPFNSLPPLIACNLKPYQEVLVMEDMKEKGFVLKNRKHALDLEHVKLVMKSYGKFHAVSYAIKDQKSDLFEIIKSNTKEDYFLLMPEDVWVKSEGVFCSKSLNSLDPVEYSAHRGVFSRYMKYPIQIIKDTFRKSHHDRYSIVCHGDSWLNNMLFKYEDKSNPEIPTDLCLLDFQLTRYGSPAFDLSYFIFTCTEKSLRDKYYDEMINVYYESLCTHLVNLGSLPENVLTFEDLEQQLKRYSVVGYFLTQTVLHLMIREVDEVPDIDKNFSEDQLLDAFNCESKNEEFYKRRISGVLIDFVEKGYFDFLSEEYE